jgi:hypothetical protein
VALQIAPLHPLASRFLLLKGLSLSSLRQHADAAATFLLGLELAPSDAALSQNFRSSVLACRRQYHSYSSRSSLSTSKSSSRVAPTGAYDVAGSSLPNNPTQARRRLAKPVRGARDRQANTVVKRVCGFLSLGDIWVEELTFWAGYNVYLSKTELKDET